MLGKHLKFSACLINYALRRMTSERVNVRAHVLLSSGQDGGEWSAS
jgi:hypothetical protein